MNDFLENRYRTLEAIANVRTFSNGRPQVHRRQEKQHHKAQNQKSGQSYHATVDPGTLTYVKFSGSHSIRQGEDFKNLSITDRSNFAKSKRLCQLLVEESQMVL